MEAQWQADRAALRDLLLTRPDLTLKATVARLGRSYNWGKKWAKRLAQTSVDDLSVLHSQSRARKTPFPGWDPLVVGTHRANPSVSASGVTAYAWPQSDPLPSATR